MNKSIAATDGKQITDGKPSSSVAQQIAAAISASQKQSTGHAPKAVTVVLSEDTLVITLYDALTPAEKALAKSADGAAKVQEFVAVMKESIAIPVKTWDERLTSAQANRMLVQADVRRKDRKEKVDKAAAAILLQSFLDSRGV